ncbi:MAG: cation:proton antiporter, partial [Pseudomonadales bacterium]
MEPLIILVAFLSGLLFRRFGYPSLPGYLLAGFACHALNIGDVQLIKALADLGILLLLFTIGIKLNLKELVSPQVWGVASLQILIAVPLTVVVIVAAGMLFPVLALKDISSAWILAFALSFSSTVFAVKMFEDRGETISLHANLTIGILVIQDILAVLYLAFTSDTPPGVSALALFLLPLLRPIGLYLLRHA